MSDLVGLAALADDGKPKHCKCGHFKYQHRSAVGVCNMCGGQCAIYQETTDETYEWQQNRPR